MNGKTARKIRKLLELKVNEEYRASESVETGIRRIGVIDGVSGNHHIREEKAYQVITNQDRKLYRTLKKEFSNFEGDISKNLKNDLKGGK